MLKRLFDLAASAILLLVALPFMLVIALIIKRNSEGPAIFAQTRVGRDETTFLCLKFRTMAQGTPNVSSHQASHAWITSVGAVLRRFKLDELPQLWNVIRGEMSLVGPRPCLPVQKELIAERRKRGVFNIRPGITGSAQLAGIDMSEPVRLAIADSEYVRNRSFLGDITILLRTAAGKGSGDAAKSSGR